MRDGAVLPILHLNGYKIANPTVLARIPHEELEALLRGYGYTPHFVEGDDPKPMHQLMAATLDEVIDEIRASSTSARATASRSGPRWPMIVLRTPKGWTGPKEVDGKQVEGSWRAHQVPIERDATNPEHVRILEELDEELPARGAVRRDGPPACRSSPRWRRRATRRMSANPHANGGVLLRDCGCRTSATTPSRCRARRRDGRGDARDGHVSCAT